jgi:hypothetical protein
VIYCEHNARGWRYLVVWVDRPSVYFASLSEAETAYTRSMCHASN